VLDRQRAGINLLAVVFGQACGQRYPDLLESAPQPAGPPVGLALVRQAREQVRPVPGHLGQEGGLAAPSRQVAHHDDGEQLGIAAGRRRAWPRRDRDEPGNDQVMDQHVDIDEQVLGRQHGDGLCGSAVFDTRLLAAEALS